MTQPIKSDDVPTSDQSSGTDSIEIWHDPEGRWHRDDGPAITRSDGYEVWCQHGELHRDDGPAVTRPDGTEQWYQRGQLVDPQQ